MSITDQHRVSLELLYHRDKSTELFAASTPQYLHISMLVGHDLHRLIAVTNTEVFIIARMAPLFIPGSNNHSLALSASNYTFGGGSSV